MGCGNSVSEQVSDSSHNRTHASPTILKSLLEKDGTIKILNAKSPLIRLDHPTGLKEFEVSGTHKVFNLKYCFVSQRGFYPKSLHKANQDSYVICERLMGQTNTHLFGVFDGHGDVGDKCSHYCADQLPEHFAREINAQGKIGTLQNTKLKKAYYKAFLNTNYALHKSDINDVYSGTTGVTVLVHGDKLICSNVGDSRAIIASEVDGQLKYSPLSNDQTPYRKDERDRLKKQGAKIMTIDQIEGNEPIHENWGTQLGNELDEAGDPPRVWDSTLEKPGCAFTRSLGDSCAEACGVFAEPEMMEWQLKDNDKFAIIASDGVFEFITSQTVVDMIGKFENPLDAAKHVVAEAYRLWLTFDDRTDDITIIIINFEYIRNLGVPHPMNNTEKTGSSIDLDRTAHSDVSAHAMSAPMKTISTTGGTPENSDHNILTALGAVVEGEKEESSDLSFKGVGQGIVNRPVRTGMSKAKRKDITESFDEQAAEQFDFDAVVDKKSRDDLSRILPMLKENFLFASLQPNQLDQICKAVVERKVTPGEVVIREGDAGDEVYLVDSGEFLVTKRAETGEEHAIFTYSNPGTAFGELSLMYGKPRGASVTSKTSGRLWTIGRSAFRSVIMAGREKGGLLKVLQGVPILGELGMLQLYHLCINSTTETYTKDKVIYDGTADEADWMLCVVLKGRVTMQPMQKARERRQSVIGPQQKPKRQHRGELCFVVADEIGSRFGSLVSDDEEGRPSKIVFIPKSVFGEVLGIDGERRLMEEAAKDKMKGKRMSLGTKVPVYENEKHTTLQRLRTKSDFTLEHPITTCGDFATIGVYKVSSTATAVSAAVSCLGDADGAKMCSIKVLAKNHANKIKGMPEAQLRERNILAAMGHSTKAGGEPCIPEVLYTYQDTKVTYLVYKDAFTCDLSTALQSNSFPEASMPCVMACIYSALCSVHSLGLEHRFINSTAVYITSLGVPKLADFRYAKVMDGRKNFTICGDPLFFAPEIVGQRGYDYGADLWALGVLYYEAYEGVTPFGTHDSEETAVFTAITSFTAAGLSFKHTPPPMQALIQRLLDPVVGTRGGYGPRAFGLRDDNAFLGVDWNELDSGKQTTPLDVQPSAEVVFLRTFQEGALQWDEETITDFSSAVFDTF